MALTTLAEAKVYLRIDSTVEDDLITNFLAAATSYINDAVNDYSTYITYDNFAAKVKIVELALITDMYENRNNSTEYSFSETVKTLMVQLQYWSADE